MQKSIFYWFRNDRILPKKYDWNSKSMKTKNYVTNFGRHTTLKNHFLWFTLGSITIMRVSK